jgi:AraC-like DNA-binding protein
MEALRPEQLQVNDIAERYAISPRQLERKFKQQIGVSPQTFINVLRNRAALAAIKKRNNCSLLKIALEYGYYDHAHLSKEIKRFTGAAPSQFNIVGFFQTTERRLTLILTDEYKLFIGCLFNNRIFLLQTGNKTNDNDGTTDKRIDTWGK